MKKSRRSTLLLLLCMSVFLMQQQVFAAPMAAETTPAEVTLDQAINNAVQEGQMTVEQADNLKNNINALKGRLQLTSEQEDELDNMIIPSILHGLMCISRPWLCPPRPGKGGGK